MLSLGPQELVIVSVVAYGLSLAMLLALWLRRHDLTKGFWITYVVLLVLALLAEKSVLRDSVSSLVLSIFDDEVTHRFSRVAATSGLTCAYVSFAGVLAYLPFGFLAGIRRGQPRTQAKVDEKKAEWQRRGLDPSLIESNRRHMCNDSTEGLLKLWRANDRRQFADEVFEAVKELLAERGVPVPPHSEMGAR